MCGTMRPPIPLTALIVAAPLALVAASNGNAGNGAAVPQSAGVVLQEFHSPWVIPGQLVLYGILVENRQKATWKNVVLRAYLPHQSAVRKLTSFTSSLPGEMKEVFSGSNAQWSVRKIEPQGNFRISLSARAAANITGALCNSKFDLMISGRLVAQKLVSCIPVRHR
jgi:hypothetical protein